MPSVEEIKETVRARAGYKCHDCGMTNDEHRFQTGRRLDVHRIAPGSRYSVESCIALCRGCHAKKPRRAKGQRDLARHHENIGIPESLYSWLGKYAASKSRPYDRKPTAWALRQAVYWFKRFIETGKSPDEPD